MMEKEKLGPPPYSGQMCYSSKEAVEYYANAVPPMPENTQSFTLSHLAAGWREICECETVKILKLFLKQPCMLLKR